MAHRRAPVALVDALALQADLDAEVRQIERPPVGDRLAAHEGRASPVVEHDSEVAARAVPVLEDRVADLERRQQELDRLRDVLLAIGLATGGQPAREPEGELALDVAVVDAELGREARRALEDCRPVDPAGRCVGHALRAPHLLAGGADLPTSRSPAEAIDQVECDPRDRAPVARPQLAGKGHAVPAGAPCGDEPDDARPFGRSKRRRASARDRAARLRGAMDGTSARAQLVHCARR